MTKNENDSDHQTPLRAGVAGALAAEGQTNADAHQPGPQPADSRPEPAPVHWVSFQKVWRNSLIFGIGIAWWPLVMMMPLGRRVLVVGPHRTV